MFARVSASFAEFPDIFGEPDPQTGSPIRINLNEFNYRKGAEIFGEKEPADYVYQVGSGAVRTYKLLSDGRRQIGAFHLVGDIFGLEIGTEHRFTAEAIVDTTVRLLKRRSLELVAESDAKVARNLLSMVSVTSSPSRECPPPPAAISPIWVPTNIAIVEVVLTLRTREEPRIA